MQVIEDVRLLQSVTPWPERRIANEVAGVAVEGKQCAQLLINWLLACTLSWWTSFAPRGLFFVLPLIIGGIAWIGYLVASFRCPRCRDFFYRGPYFYNYMTRKCVHCRLAKWATP